MRVLALVVLAGCGRIAFDPIDRPNDAGTVDTVAESALVAWYPMDDAIVPVVNDATGHGHDARCIISDSTCPIPITGARGLHSFHFDGTNDELAIPSTPELELSTGFTVAFWLRMTAAPAFRSCPVQKPIGVGLDDSWQLCVDPDASFFYFTSDGTNPDFFNTVDKLPFDGWHHLALLWDGVNKVITLDGTVIDSRQVGVAFDTAPVYFGADHDGTFVVSPFEGDLDDVRIYNRPLTPLELAALIQ